VRSHGRFPAGIVIAFVQRQVLWLLLAGLRALDDDGIQRSLQQLAVVAVGSGDDDAQRAT
jgi:hypothetical protein